MMRRLEELERLFPELQSQDQPTQTVGGRADSTLFTPVRHAERMLSLDNVFSRDEFLAWAAKVERDSGRAVHYLCELKIDGLAMNLRYENGTLVSAATRGDGVVGEDVTENVNLIAGIPKKLDTKNPPPLVEVRGEVFFNEDAFERLNAVQAEAGDRLFANPRNAASGSLRQKRENKNADAVARMENRIEGCACWCTASEHGLTRGTNPAHPSNRKARSTGCSSRWGLPTASSFKVVESAAAGRRTSSSTTASTGTTSSTRSTASCSRSTSSRCTTSSARPAGRRAGRSPTSTRPSRCRRSCSTSWCRSGAPAARRRSR